MKGSVNDDSLYFVFERFRKREGVFFNSVCANKNISGNRLFGVFFGGSLLLFGDGIAPTIFEWASQFGYYFLQFTALSWINHMFLVPAIA